MNKNKNIITFFLLTLLSFSCSKKDNGNFDDAKDDEETFEDVDVPIEGLIAYYPFNGNADDESSNGNNGTTFGAVLSTDRFGNDNAAFQFDGDNDYIEITPMSDVSAIGDFTFSVWTYLEQWEIQSGFRELDRQYVFDGHADSSTATDNFLRPGFNVEFVLSLTEQEQMQNSFFYATDDILNNYLETNTNMPVKGQWYHIVWGRNGDQDFTYVNGDLMVQTYASKINKDTELDMQHNWYIGTFSGNNPNYSEFNYNFHGKIDDIRFYDVALEEKFIKALYRE
ncbi:LamG-like jellyroll fold domain-containing protein [Maribacter sp. CXY002]|uniref:LamG-like jellyroll fold domain-containing protein n=1 Tax=Maribacter luteocoastalis TaxID=3407671 RepID=UPI003B66D101